MKNKNEADGNRQTNRASCVLRLGGVGSEAAAAGAADAAAAAAADGAWTVGAVAPDGVIPVEPWPFLEVCGAGWEEQPALPPAAWGVQGGRDGWGGGGGAAVGEGIARLKGTYRVYACLLQ